MYLVLHQKLQFVWHVRKKRLDFYNHQVRQHLVKKQLHAFLLSPGAPNSPSNFTYYPDYSTIANSRIDVDLMWLPSTAIDQMAIEYVITISSVADRSTIQTTHSSHRVTLDFNTTYSVELYASKCSQALMSTPIHQNITIREDDHLNITKEGIVHSGMWLQGCLRTGIGP